MTDASAPAPEEAERAERPRRTGKERRRAEKRRKKRVEFAGALIIGIAAVLTAIATFQGSKVDGTVEEKNTEAITTVLLANDAYNDANRERLTERDWIFSYIAEAINGQPAADVLLAAMPAEVVLLAAEWLEANSEAFANPSPELIGDPFSADYESTGDLPSEALLSLGDTRFVEAQCAFFEARVAGAEGDNYGLATVFLAIALVVGGIAALLNGKAAQILVLTVATLSLVGGAGILAIAGDANQARGEQAVEFFVNDDGTPRVAVDEDGLPVDIDAAVDLAEESCPSTAARDGEASP